MKLKFKVVQLKMTCFSFIQRSSYNHPLSLRRKILGLVRCILALDLLCFFQDSMSTLQEIQTNHCFLWAEPTSYFDRSITLTPKPLCLLGCVRVFVVFALFHHSHNGQNRMCRGDIVLLGNLCLKCAPGYICLLQVPSW